MSINAYKNSLELAILSASPMQLVRMLYDGAIKAVETAITKLGEGDIRGRSDQITKACAIIEELTLSLDKSRGGEISRQLTDLYLYIHQRLLQANIEQSLKPLEESLHLLRTLQEAWKQVPDNAGTADGLGTPTNAGVSGSFGAGMDHPNLLDNPMLRTANLGGVALTDSGTMNSGSMNSEAAAGSNAATSLAALSAALGSDKVGAYPAPQYPNSQPQGSAQVYGSTQANGPAQVSHAHLFGSSSKAKSLVDAEELAAARPRLHLSA